MPIYYYEDGTSEDVHETHVEDFRKEYPTATLEPPKVEKQTDVIDQGTTLTSETTVPAGLEFPSGDFSLDSLLKIQPTAQDPTSIPTRPMSVEEVDDRNIQLLTDEEKAYKEIGDKNAEVIINETDKADYNQDGVVDFDTSETIQHETGGIMKTVTMGGVTRGGSETYYQYTPEHPNYQNSEVKKFGVIPLKNTPTQEEIDKIEADIYLNRLHTRQAEYVKEMQSEEAQQDLLEEEDLAARLYEMDLQKDTTKSKTSEETVQEDEDSLLREVSEEDEERLEYSTLTDHQTKMNELVLAKQAKLSSEWYKDFQKQEIASIKALTDAINERAQDELRLLLEPFRKQIFNKYQQEVSDGNITVEEASVAMQKDLDAEATILSKTINPKYEKEFNEKHDELWEQFTASYLKDGDNLDQTWKDIAKEWDRDLDYSQTSFSIEKYEEFDKMLDAENFWSYDATTKKRMLDNMWLAAEEGLIDGGLNPDTVDGREAISKRRTEFYYRYFNKNKEEENGNMSRFWMENYANINLDEVEEEMKKIEERMKEIETNTPANKWNTTQEERTELMLQHRSLKQELYTLNKIKNAPGTLSKSWISNYGNSLVSGGWDVRNIPFIGSGFQILDMVKILRITKIPAEKRTQEQQRTIDHVAMRQESDKQVADMSRSISTTGGMQNSGWMAAQTTRSSVPYMLEFMFTGPVFGAVRKSVSKGLKNVLIRQIDEVISHIPGAVRGKMAKGVTNNAIDGLSLLMGTVAQTAVNPQQWVRSTLAEMTPQIAFAFSEEGDKLIMEADAIDDGTTFFESLPRGFALSWSDTFTERLGASIPMLNKWFRGKGLYGKVNPLSGRSKLKETLLKRMLLGRWISKMNTYSSPALLRKLKDAGGWNGLLGENFEEIINVPLQNLITGKDLLHTEAGWGNFLKEMFGGIAMTQVGFGAIGSAHNMMRGGGGQLYEIDDVLFDNFNEFADAYNSGLENGLITNKTKIKIKNNSLVAEQIEQTLEARGLDIDEILTAENSREIIDDTVTAQTIDVRNKLTNEENGKLLKLEERLKILQGEKYFIENDETQPLDFRKKQINSLTSEIKRINNDITNITKDSIAAVVKERGTKILSETTSKVDKIGKRIYGERFKKSEKVSEQELKRKLIASEEKKKKQLLQKQKFHEEGSKAWNDIQEKIDGTNKLIEDYQSGKELNAFGMGIDERYSESGKFEILINEDRAYRNAGVNTAAHEFLHMVLVPTLRDKPQTAIALGVTLLGYLKLGGVDSAIANRLSAYYPGFEQLSKEEQRAWLNDPIIVGHVMAEEVLTLFSDAIATGKIQFEETFFTKLGDILRRIFQSIGLNITFRNGRDVYNFIRDYQRGIEKGKLSRAIRKGARKGFKTGGEIAVDEEAVRRFDAMDVREEASKQSKQTEAGAKFEKKIQDLWQAQQDLDSLLSERSKLKAENIEIAKTGITKKVRENSARIKEINSIILDDKKNIRNFYGEIVEAFRPRIAKKLRAEWAWTEKDPGKFGLIIENALGDGRGILGMLLNKNTPYDPTGGVPLAAYINTLLDRRMRPGPGSYIQSVYPKDVIETSKDSEGMRELVDNMTNEESIITTNDQISLNVLKGVLNIPNVNIEDLSTELELTQNRIKEIKSTDLSKLKPEQLEQINEELQDLEEKLEGLEFYQQIVLEVQNVINEGKVKDATSEEFRLQLAEAMRKSGLMKLIRDRMGKLSGSAAKGFVASDQYRTFLMAHGPSIYKKMSQQLMNKRYQPFINKLMNEFTGKEFRKNVERSKKEGIKDEAAGNRIFKKRNYNQQEWLDYHLNPKNVFNGKGRPDTRRTALAESIAEEFGFDIFFSVIANAQVESNNLDKINAQIGLISKKINRDPAAKMSLAPSDLSEINKTIFILGRNDYLSNLANAGSKGDVRIAFDKTYGKDTFGDDRNRIINKTWKTLSNGLELLKKFEDAGVEAEFAIEDYLVADELQPETKIKDFLKLDQSITDLYKNSPYDIELHRAGYKLFIAERLELIYKGDIKAWLQETITWKDFIEKGSQDPRRAKAFYGKSELLETYDEIVPGISEVNSIDFYNNLKDKSNYSKPRQGVYNIPIRNKNGDIIGSEEVRKAKIASTEKTKAKINGTEDLDLHEQTAVLAREYTDSYIKFIVDQVKDKDSLFTKNQLGMAMAAQLGGMTTSLRVAAPWRYYPLNPPSQNPTDYEYEHGTPALSVIIMLVDMHLNNNTKLSTDLIFSNYAVGMIPKDMNDNFGRKGLFAQRPQFGYEVGDLPTRRWFNMFTAYGPNYAVVDARTEEVYGAQYESRWKDILANRQNLAKVNGVSKQSLDMDDFAKEHDKKRKVSVAKQNARLTNANTERRGMSTFDFDETLIIKGENFVTATKGKESIKISSENFPLEGPRLEAEGYNFDFKDFVNVKGGIEGPLMQKLKNQIAKYGNKNVFVLTARMQEAAPAIQAWLKSQGIELPIENITGLGKSEGNAKAVWFLDKYAEGYNDMYFVDDALPNVEAVRHIFNQLDVKGKSVQAIAKFSLELSPEFNKMLERTKDIGAEKVFSRIGAQKRGKNIGRFTFFVPPSADDFVGLLRYFVGKGKQGDADIAFFKKALVDPFSRADEEMKRMRQSMVDDYKALRKRFPDVKKKLGEMISESGFTYDNAIRVYLWNKAGFKIPGLSKRDIALLVNTVESDLELQEFANTLELISKESEGYVKPGEYWNVESIAADLENIVNKVNRKKYLAEWIQNKDVIFSEDNLNKIEATYGSNFREALENILYRMENGTNRSKGMGRIEGAWNNWVNNSVGAIMFFNARSAVLQTLSTVNFINFEDNNMFAAAKAFANQKQYWKDFVFLFNSDFLKQRRAGLSINVNEAELASAVAGATNKAKAALQYLLKIGFLPTQIADSFAIAAGGGTYYRNRIKRYVAEGMDQKAAEEQAMVDFMEIAEETQQSARPDRISQQQASSLGRIILAFANTPMQYNRLIKKAAGDLINKRGDWRSNISRIVYYGAIQNIIFSGLQSAIFALAFDDDDDDEQLNKKSERMLNGMIDSLLRGSGLAGAVVATIKNTILKFMEESDKGFRADYGNVIVQALNVSPPLGSKVRKLYNSTKTYKFNKEVMGEMETLDLENPMWDIVGNVVEATTNIPLNRGFRKIDNLKEMLNQDNETWQRIFVGLGWDQWGLNIDTRKEVEAVREVIKEKKKEEKKIENAIKREEKKKEVEKANEALVEENKEKQKKEGEDATCAAISSKGNRCKRKSINDGFCTVHEKVKQNDTGKKTQCSKIKSDGVRCKVETASKSKLCYYHD